MPSLKALVLFATASMAAVLPAGHDDAKRAEVPTQTAFEPPAVARPAAVTPSVSLPPSCDYSYCDGTSSWCFYWAGVTSYDPKLGPVPGETRANIGPCTVAPAPTPSPSKA